MANVIGVRFQNAGKLYYFDPDTNWPTAGDYVIVDTTRGMALGEVVVPVHELDDEQLTAPLKKVVRVASAEDIQHDKENHEAEKEAFRICQEKIEEHQLDMKLVSVEYTFDNSKVLFYFTSNGRVDFRALVKDLAAIFRTRIELRQIGVRDEAKMLGGLGPCGRPICCGTFLGDFQPVSIKMAKEQNLSLNPTKISGVCGRLMCCLKYEEDTYEEIRKSMPRVGKEVMTPDGPGTVWEQHVIKESLRVRVQKGDSGELRDYPMDQVQLIAKGSHCVHAAHEDENDQLVAAADAPDEVETTAPVETENTEAAEEAAAETPVAAPVETPVEEAEPVEEEASEPVKQPEKPVEKPANAANSWKEALERAMRAAGGADSDQTVDEAAQDVDVVEE